MDQTAAVLFANEAFYLAFRSNDVDAMERLWARQVPVACIHPGWPPIVGREQVMETWRRILVAEARNAIQCLEPQALVMGDAAVVICFEHVSQQYLVATNMFIREDGQWRMTHHQAGPVAEGPARRPPEPVAPVH